MLFLFFFVFLVFSSFSLSHRIALGYQLPTCIFFYGPTMEPHEEWNPNQSAVVNNSSPFLLPLRTPENHKGKIQRYTDAETSSFVGRKNTKDYSTRQLHFVRIWRSSFFAFRLALLLCVRIVIWCLPCLGPIHLI